MRAQLLASDRRTARQPEQTLGPLGIPARELRPRRPKIDRGGAGSRALRTMRDFCPRNEPVRPSRPTEAKTLTQRQRGVVIARENRPLGGIIASEFADLAAAWWWRTRWRADV